MSARFAAVADRRGPEPDRSVLLVHESPLAKDLDRLGNLAALFDRGLRVPLVEMDVEPVERRPYVLEDRLAREPARFDDVLGSLVAPCELGHVLALIALFRHDVATAPSKQALAKKADLAACVVHVELPFHLPAAAAHHPPEGVAVGAEPAVAHVQRTGRVRGHELDLHPLALAEIGSRIVLCAGLDDLGQRGAATSWQA